MKRTYVLVHTIIDLLIIVSYVNSRITTVYELQKPLKYKLEKRKGDLAYVRIEPMICLLLHYALTITLRRRQTVQPFN